VDRFERLTNLVAVLLATPRPLRLDEITERVPGYPPEGESRRRQFERDKETLRELGVPVAVVVTDSFGGTAESAYRIEPSEYYLPRLDLTPDEVGALTAAMAAVQLGTGSAHEAAWKLGGRTHDGTAVPPLAALPVVEALPRLFEAYRRRAVATFAYRGEERRLEPWAIVFRRGHWYAVGRDGLRDAPRSFRVDRIGGEVVVGRPGAFERPAPFDPSRVLADEPWRSGVDAAVEARLLVDADQAPWVSAQPGIEVERGAPEGTGGAVVVRLAVTNRDAFRSFVLGLLDHAEVLGPPELRAEVTTWLDATAAAYAESDADGGADRRGDGGDDRGGNGGGDGGGA
jgi:predicted DNA-binding transcriptional regulator YafY